MLVLSIRGHLAALKGDRDEVLEAEQLPPPLLFHHRNVLPLPSLSERLDGRHLRETSWESDGEQETVESVD